MDTESGFLAAVGQTALSNYLGTSLICTLIFNGYGLGLFGKLQFYRLSFIVVGVWLVKSDRKPCLAKVFPLRSTGMDLAVADAGSRSQCCAETRLGL